VTTRQRLAALALALAPAVAAALAAGDARALLDVQAHRGGSDGPAPPGTLAAWQHAVAIGATTLELDAQVTADGVLVAYHDQVLDRRRCRRAGGGALGSRVLAELAWADVADVECEAGHRLPRVAEVLALAREAPRPVHVSVEIKMQDEDRGVALPRFAALLVDLLSREGVADRALVQSFRAEALREIRRIAPELPTAILVRDRRELQRLVDETGARVLSPRRDELREGDVPRFHAQGVAVIPWTVNDPDEMRRFVSWGVDGLITDRPGLALSLFGPDASPPPEASP
jgi:glycerophosphoryl diester phosphodiesterase